MTYSPLIAPVPVANNGDFTPAPAGVWPARLFRIVDLGSQSETLDGKTRQRQKLLLSFEILDEAARQADGKPSTVHRRLTFSLSQQSALRILLDSWLCRKLTDAEAADFDFSKLLGQYALVTVVHSERAGQTRADLAGIMPLPKGMTPPPGVNPLILFTASNPDLSVMDGLGRGLREAIESSPEFKRAMAGMQTSQFTGPATTPAPNQPPQPAPHA
jgi:hypothetical protein